MLGDRVTPPRGAYCCHVPAWLELSSPESCRVESAGCNGRNAAVVKLSKHFSPLPVGKA